MNRFLGNFIFWHCPLYFDIPVWITEYLASTVDTDGLWPLLLTWFNFNPSMDK